jgi:hypothetical protein
MFMTGGTKAAALSCPNSFQDAVNNHNWGVNTGGHTGDMAGLIVHAYDASNNNNVVAKLNLHSGIPNASGQYSDPYWGRTPNGTTVNLNDRIFHDFNGLPAGYENDPTNRTNNFQFSTDDCSSHGWMAFGPSSPLANGYTGNGEVLDCGPTNAPTRFWFTNVSTNPFYDGTNGQNGYWSVHVFDPHTGRNFVIDHYTEGSTSFYSHYFTVSNGYSTFVDLIWHPQSPPPTPGNTSGTGICQYLKIDETAGSTRRRVWVTANGVSVGKSKYTDNSGGAHWSPGPTGDDTYNPRPLSIASWVGPGGQNGDTSLSVSKEWWFQPVANSIQVTYRTDTLSGSTWSNGTTYYLDTNGNWSTNPSTVVNCFTANTCVNPLTIDGDGPSDVVVASGVIHVSGLYKNTGLLPLWYPAVTASDGNTYPVQISGSTLDPGQTAPFSFTMGAPPTVQTYSLSVNPVYFGAMATPPSQSCSANVPIYQWFSSSLGAQSSLNPTVEHPYQGADYKTIINVKNDSSHDVNIPTASSFYTKPVGGGQTTIASAGGGTYPSSPGGTTTTTLSGHYDIPSGSYKAGDEYCAHVHADYTEGYVGPDNSVVGKQNPQDATSCPRVTNEPYFKIYNSDISAGGSFNNCTSDGGTLAGYADVSDPPGATRGSSTELSALALVKATGVASAQGTSNINGLPTKLTFANTGVQVDNTGNESPVLGGQFGGCRKLTNETAPSSATSFGGATFPIAGKNGPYKHTGNLRVNGSSLGASQNVSLFVDGDIYIASNVTYGNNWQAGTAPSLVVHATGNIYIASGVKHLAGLYIAQDKPDGSKGKIYTCATAAGSNFTPVATAQLYNSCKNQLVVTGSFVAKQTNLMRTFGSLRDEEPNPPAAAGSQTGFVWSCGGADCNPSLGGMKCVHTNEPADPYAWDDNQLCIPGTLPDGSAQPLKLGWTHWPDSPYNDPRRGPARRDPGNLSLTYWKTHGYPNCTEFKLPGVPYWDDAEPNYLCYSDVDGKNPGINFQINNDPTQSCIRMYEPYPDPSGNWASGYYLCEPKASAGGPATPKGPPYTDCSNKTSASQQTDNNACSSEIFEYSPTLYLSSPVVNPPAGGSLQLQSITSLPPVL